MKNHKFKFSDMIPNAWFYKLKDMSKSRSKAHHPTKTHQYPRTSSPSPSFSSYQPHNHMPSYCNSPVNLKAYDTQFPDHPRRSPINTVRARRRTIYHPSPKTTAAPSTAGCGHRNATTVWRASKSILLQSPDDYASAFETSSESESLLSEDEDATNENSVTSLSLLSSSNGIVGNSPNCVSSATAQKQRPPSRRFRAKSGGIKLRTSVSSPRVRAISGKSEKSGSVEESFVVVKSSFDPQRDFKESMVEMIVENKIRSSKDLEKLLACYLSLNSKQFQAQIVQAFQEIWMERIYQRP